jgi:hypothetical protein
MVEFYGSRGDTPFMLNIFTNLQDYLWRERMYPKDFKDQANMENGREKLAVMIISIHKGAVTQQRLNQSYLKW